MVAKLIKMAYGYLGYNMASFAKKLNTSRPNLHQKLHRDNFTESDMLRMAAALDCDLKISLIDRRTGKEFYCVSSEEITADARDKE